MAEPYGVSQRVETVFSTRCLSFRNFEKASKTTDFNGEGHPFLGFPHTPFLTVITNIPLYRQSQTPRVAEPYRVSQRVEKVFSTRCLSFETPKKLQKLLISMARDTLLGFPSHTLPYRYHKYTALPAVSDTPYGRAIRGVFSSFFQARITASAASEHGECRPPEIPPTSA